MLRQIYIFINTIGPHRGAYGRTFVQTSYYQLKQFIQLHYKYYWSAQRCIWTDLCADLILILSIETIYTITCGPHSVRIDGCLCGPHINF